MFLGLIENGNATQVIFSFLEDPRDLAMCMRVCRVWKAVGEEAWKLRLKERMSLEHPPSASLSGEQKGALCSEFRVRRLEKVEKPFARMNGSSSSNVSVANGYLFLSTPSFPNLQQFDVLANRRVYTYNSHGKKHFIENNRLVFYGESQPVEIWDFTKKSRLLTMDMTLDSRDRVSVNDRWMVKTTIAAGDSSKVITHSAISLDEVGGSFLHAYEEENYQITTLLKGDRFYSLSSSDPRSNRKSRLRVWDLKTKNEVGFLESKDEPFTKMVPWSDFVYLDNKKGVLRWKLGESGASRFIDFPKAEDVFLLKNDKNVLTVGSLGHPLRFYSLLDGQMVSMLPGNLTHSVTTDLSGDVFSAVSHFGVVNRYALRPSTTTSEAPLESGAWKRKRSEDEE